MTWHAWLWAQSSVRLLQDGIDETQVPDPLGRRATAIKRLVYNTLTTFPDLPIGGQLIFTSNTRKLGNVGIRLVVHCSNCSNEESLSGRGGGGHLRFRHLSRRVALFSRRGYLLGRCRYLSTGVVFGTGSRMKQSSNMNRRGRRGKYCGKSLTSRNSDRSPVRGRDR